MENKCAFKNCQTTCEDFFYSPSDPTLLKKWQKVVDTRQTDFCVCINHFRKHDIVLEKSLEENAIPVAGMIKSDVKLSRNCCGSCMKEMKDQTAVATKELAKNFHEITEYRLVTDILCIQCAHFLKTLTRFKKDIAEHHRRIRNEDGDEDIVVVAPKKINLPIIQRSNFQEQPEKTKILRMCRHCTYRSYDKEVFLEHIRTFHGEASNTSGIISVIVPSDEVECFYCNIKFVSDSDLRIHQSNVHSKKESSKNTPKPATKSIVVSSPRSLASSTSTLDHSRLKLLAKLESTIKGRVCPPEQESVPKIHRPMMMKSLKQPSSTVATSKQRVQEFEIFDLEEICIKDEETVVKKEILEEISAIEIKNIEDILSNKNRRKQNIARELIDDAGVIFKEEVAEEEVEAEILPIVPNLSDSDKSSGESEDETQNSLNYIPPKKKPFIPSKAPLNDKEFFGPTLYSSDANVVSATIAKKTYHKAEQPVPNPPARTSETGSELVQCLDCKVFMTFEKLWPHRFEMHSDTMASSYDDITKSKLPPLCYPMMMKKKKAKPVRSLKRVACSKCNRMMQEWKLESHMEMFHSDKPMPFLCHICTRTFPQITQLRYHMVSHDPDSQFRCDLCGYGFTTKTKMSRHIHRLHLNIYKVKDVCKICNQKIYKAGRIIKHMRQYHPNGLDEGYRVNSETNYFDCEKCGASYADLFTMKRHDCNKGQFQLRCPDCNKPCKNDECLQKHQKTKCVKLNPHSVLNSKKF
jgi:hypothetical protein